MTKMIERFIACLLVLTTTFATSGAAAGQTASPSAPPQASAPAAPPAAAAAKSAKAPAPAPEPPGAPWPRVMTYQGATISIFQPQVESWTGNQITGRFAPCA